MRKTIIIVRGKGSDLFPTAQQKMKTKDCEQQILADLQKWQQTHKPLIFNRSGIQRKKGYRYLHWLKAKGALDAYLDRSISYIFLRDLGKSLQDPETKQRIQSLVEKFTKDLTKKDASDAANLFSIEWLYRQGKDYALNQQLFG